MTEVGVIEVEDRRVVRKMAMWKWRFVGSVSNVVCWDRSRSL